MLSVITQIVMTFSVLSVIMLGSALFIVMLSVAMLCIITQTELMPSLIILNVNILGAALFYCNAECHYADCCNAGGHYADGNYTVFHRTVSLSRVAIFIFMLRVIIMKKTL